MTIEDLDHIQFVSSPHISPDGRRVAYVVTTIDQRTYEYRSAVWLNSLDGGEATRFIAGPASASSPVWSPDGRWLAFVSEREGEALSNKEPGEAKKLGKGKPQIWLIPTDGGEARQVTFQPHGASNPTWSPDSRRLVFAAQVGPLDEESPDGKVLPKARRIDRLWYRLDGVGFIYERRQHLFLIDRDGGEALQLTDGDWDDNDPIWSPDGQRLAFVSSRQEDRWRLPNQDLYTLSIVDGKAGELRRLTNGSIGCGSPTWSPDGRSIAFLASLKLRSGGHIDLYTIDAGASEGEARSLTQEFEGTCMDWTNSDMGDEHLMPRPAWSADGERLYVLSSHRGASRIFVIPRDGAGRELATLTPGNVHVRDFSSDAACTTLALLVGDPTHPPEVYARSTDESGELKRITHCNDALIDELELASPEYMSYTGADGWPMDGWILKPRDFDPAKKYPLIVEIHGGPQTQYGYGFFHEMQLLGAAGYVVLYTNPRGSCGYGRDFSLAVRGAWGEKDSLDILAGLDALLARGYVDEQRIGVTGGSYGGGFMTNWLIGHSDRFRAAVTDRSVTNLASDFGSGDFGWSFADDELDTTPWDDLDRYMRMSPITYVKEMHTPLLILHSEQDLRCHVEQADQLFAALKYLGREVEYVRFEGQSHGLSRGGHPVLRKKRLQLIRDWFDKYM